MKDHFLVTAWPVPRFDIPLKRPGPFSETLDDFMGLHDSGRAAIYWACRGLGLASGTRIWMPALHCGVEVQAALDAGLNPEFYRIVDDLTIDEEDLERKLSCKPGVVFLIHYFGFAQSSIKRIADLCRRRGSVLIEDCGHALFSEFQGRELGDFAPIAIFSLRKTLPIPDGGALKLNLESLQRVTERPFQPPQRGKFSFEMFFGYPKSAARASLGPRITGVYRSLRSHGADKQQAPKSDPNFRPTRPYTLGMSLLSRRAAARADPAGISDRRRRNYLALDKALTGTFGFLKVFDELPASICPLFMPIWVADRETLRSALFRQGVETFRFGAAPHPKLNADLRSETAQMRDNILCLPVHDQITDNDIEKVARIVRPLLAWHAFSPRREPDRNIRPQFSASVASSI
jgi:perosamine synthetase